MAHFKVGDVIQHGSNRLKVLEKCGTEMYVCLWEDCANQYVIGKKGTYRYFNDLDRFSVVSSGPVVAKEDTMTQEEVSVLKALGVSFKVGRFVAKGIFWVISLSPWLTAAAVAIPYTRPHVLMQASNLLAYFAQAK